MMRFSLAALTFLLYFQSSALAQTVKDATAEAVVDHCPSNMVNIDNHYCMDRYEYPNRKGEVPFAGVTWLEAAAKCKAEGKRLCSSSEWQRACEGSSKQTYPYGNQFDRRKCNSGREHTHGAVPSGSHPDCQSEEGVFDLSGNLWEWTGLEQEDAALAGGGWMTDGDHSRCDTRAWQGVPKASNFTYGFRCCVSLLKTKDIPLNPPSNKGDKRSGE